MVRRRGREKTLCARGADQATSRGRSISPLERMNMKRHLPLILLVVVLGVAGAGHAGSGSANRVLTVTIGKRFNPGEVATVVDPTLRPLGFERLSEKAQYRAIGAPEMSWYGALGYVQGNPSLYYEGKGSISVLIFADRSLNCVRISVTDLTQAPDQRIIPTIGAIATALSKQYGAGMKRYSDLQCLHAL